MKHLGRVTKRGEDTFFSFAFQLSEKEVSGSLKISDIPYTSPEGIMEAFNEDPDAGIKFIRQFIYLIDIWNTRDTPGSQMVIQEMQKRGHNEPTRRRSKRKVKTRIRRRLSRDS